MLRILLLIILVCLFYAISKRFLLFLKANQTQKTSHQTSKIEEKIVKCAYCGTHIPLSEAMTTNVQEDEKLFVCKNQPCITASD